MHRSLVHPVCPSGHHKLFRKCCCSRSQLCPHWECCHSQAIHHHLHNLKTNKHKPIVAFHLMYTHQMKLLTTLRGTLYKITLLTAADTISSVSTVTCTCKTSICVVTGRINVTVVYWIGHIAFIDIFTVEPISQIASVTVAVIASNVVCAGSIYVTLICLSCTLINICM